MTTWKKKLVSFLLLFLLTVELLPATAFASDIVGGYCGSEGDGTNLSWSLDLDTGELTISGTGEMKEWSNNSSWYNYKESIILVNIGENITSIGANAFKDCTNIKTVELPDSVVKIGRSAFSGCRNLSGNLKLPAYTVQIGDNAFSGCENLEGILEIPESVETLGNYSFSNCKKLYGALNIPKNVSSIGNGTFAECTSISSVSVDKENANFLIENGILINKDKTRVLWCPTTRSGKILLPKETKSIDGYAFYECKELTGPLIFPMGLKSIGAEAFWECTGISGDLIIPEGVNTVGAYCFAYTKFGGKLSLPSSLKHIYSGVFLSTKFSGELVIPETTTSIYSVAFSKSKGFDKKLILPESITGVAQNSFGYCNWIQEVEIGSKIVAIESGAFTNCTALEKAVFRGQAPSSIKETSFPKSTVLYYPEGREDWTTPTWNGYTTVSYKLDEPEEPATTVDVSLNCNGGTCDKNKISVTVGQAYGALPTPTYPGHVFQGWYTKQEGGDKIAEDTIVTAKEAHTLYAHWTTETYQITYDANGGTGAPEAQKKSYGTNLILSKMVPTRDNYIFQGWAENKTATQAKYQPGAAYTEDRAATLYAVWQQSVPENTAIVSVGNVTLKPGETAEVVASIQNNPGIAGYHFEVAADTSVFSVPKEDGELLVERGDFSKKGSVFANVNENGWEMLWYHTNNVTTDGALFRMTVTVSDDAAPGVYPITIQGVPEDIVDENGNMVSLTCVPGTITVADVLLGDVNGDGERTNLDVIYLARSLLGLVTLNDSQKSAADVNGDGNVGNADVIRLARVLIGLDQI